MELYRQAIIIPLILRLKLSVILTRVIFSTVARNIALLPFYHPLMNILFLLLMHVFLSILSVFRVLSYSKICSYSVAVTLTIFQKAFSSMSEKRPASDEATDGESQVAKRSKLDGQHFFTILRSYFFSEEREVLAGLIVQLKQQVQSDKPVCFKILSIRFAQMNIFR